MRPLFGVDEGTVTLVGLVMGGVGTGVGWLVTYLSSKHKTSLTEYQELLEGERKERIKDETRCQEQVNRLDARVANLEASIRRFFVLYSEEHSRSLDFHALLALQSGVINRQNIRLEKLGQPIELNPEIPPKPTRDQQIEADFMINTAAQQKISADAVRNQLGK